MINILRVHLLGSIAEIQQPSSGFSSILGTTCTLVVLNRTTALLQWSPEDSLLRKSFMSLFFSFGTSFSWNPMSGAIEWLVAMSAAGCHVGGCRRSELRWREVSSGVVVPSESTSRTHTKHFDMSSTQSTGHRQVHFHCYCTYNRRSP